MNLDFALVLVVLTGISGVVWLFDALLLKQRRKDRAAKAGDQPPQEPVLVEYARSLFPVLLVVLVFRSFLFEPFKIPSGSMIPTLVVGDFIVVNKFTYGLRLPVTNQKFVSYHSPTRGDVVVFRYPPDPTINFIKRVVGVPGDTISYRNKRVYLNGEAVDMNDGAPYLSSETKCATPRSDAVRYQEDLGNRRHDILLHKNMPDEDGQWVVPQDHYFVMGDNRDRSNDSREWGFVPEQNLVGKAVGIWLNFDLNKGCADWGRVGNGIE